MNIPLEVNFKSFVEVGNERTVVGSRIHARKNSTMWLIRTPYVFRYYLLPGAGTKDVKRLTTKSNVMHPGQWMYKIGWPSMAALNVEAADSYFQKESYRALYFIAEQR